MTIEAVSFIPPLQDITVGLEAPVKSSADFSVWMEKQLGNVNDKIIESDRQLQGLALGETNNLHQVMLSLEDAKMSFQLAVQVRNRLLEAYQDILRMQV